MPDDAVEICWLRLDGLTPRQWAFCVSLLDDDERLRAGRFHFKADRDRFVGRHALLRLMLTRCAPIAPASWRFGTGSHGKPFIVHPADTGLHFNLSHTKGLVACAVTRAGDIGLDIETIDPGYPALRVADFGFAVEEIAALRKAAPRQRPTIFAALWVLKEAYVKAIGKGLSIPLDSFAFGLDPPRLLRADPRHAASGDWLFHVHHPTARHVMALAFALRAERRMQIDRREVTLAQLASVPHARVEAPLRR
jgi:4'-phosphopantetheinyl transferase